MVKGISLTSGLRYTPTSVRPVHAFHLSSCTNVHVHMCEYFVTPWKLLKPLWLHTEVFVCLCVCLHPSVFSLLNTHSRFGGWRCSCSYCRYVKGDKLMLFWSPLNLN